MIEVIPVVLCGGAGTRLWPLSRKSFPKQFTSLFGDKSLLQITCERVAGLSRQQICVAAEEHRYLVAEILELADVSGTVILESAPQNTAFAMGVAALQAQRQAAKDALLLFCPADHYMPDADLFAATIEQGVDAAQSGLIVTFGVAPTFPSTAFGYIQTGGEWPGGSQRVLEFIEKPQEEAARRLSGKLGVLWNAGIFLTRADTLLAALEEHAPEILAGCTKALGATTTDYPNPRGSTEFVHLRTDCLEPSHAKSFDYAVMEKHDAVAVIPFAGKWSDVGNWSAVADLTVSGESGNGGVGKSLAVHSRNNYIHAPHRLVVALGVQNLLIIDTPDALLVANRRYAEEVKDVVRELDCQQAITHRKVHRPWGWYDSVDFGARFQVKRLMVKVGASLSLQLHRHRAEHWVVVKGTAEVTRGTERFLLTENQSAYIPLGEKHRLANLGKVPLEIVEVQSGGYLGEDDIERFEDNYGRQIQ